MRDNNLKNIKKAKNFLKNYSNDKFLPYKDSIFYLATYTNSIGYYILKTLFNKKDSNLFDNIKLILLDILYGLNYESFKGNLNQSNFNYKKIIITWAFKYSFNSKGELNDKYFGLNSSETDDVLWFVVYLSKEKPKKIRDNIILFQALGSKRKNVLSWIKFIVFKIPILFKNFKYFLVNISNFNYFSEIFLKKTIPYFNNNIKYILMPYEGQPFQNRLIGFSKKNYPKIKIIGYIHSPPIAIPTNFIYKNFSPDKIVVSGKEQAHCFTKLLGWKSKKIQIEPSFRFKKKNNNLKNTIFLPISVKNSKNVLKSLEYINDKFANLKSFEIKNHPAALNSKKNIQLINQIKKLPGKNSKLKKSNKNYLIFIGNSGAIIEYLERGSKVIQICENPLIDYYSDKVWPSLKSTKLTNNVFIYTLKKRGNLIKLGNKKTNLNRILN